MTADGAIELIRNAVQLALVVAAPLLIVSLITGVLVSLFQALTQIQEQTLTFIPKILAMAVVFILSLPWILSRLIEYLVGTINHLSTLGG
jgi:flagellar biosynthetic protein FliQ